MGLLVCECAGGAAAATWPRCVGGGGAGDGARGGAVGALQGHYAVPDYEHFTTAVDLAQTEVDVVHLPFNCFEMVTIAARRSKM